MNHRNPSRFFLPALLFLIVLIALFTSCAPNPSLDGDTIPVCSATFPDLVAMKAKPFDAKASEAAQRNGYPALEVYLDNGNLCIKQYKNNDVCLEPVIGGHLYGVDCGEFGGYVAFCPGENFMPVQLCNENCQALIQVNFYEYYAITGLAHMFSNFGSVYRLTYSSENAQWSAEKLVDLGGRAWAHVYDEENGLLYLSVANRGLLCMDAQGELTTVATHEDWYDVGANSLVLLEDNLFFGGANGIGRYSFDTQELTFFPMDYETYWEEHE